jgi:nitrile hydratase
MLARGGPASREAPRPARFAVGDRVRTRNIHPHTHTRLPRYARDKVGTVELVHGAHVFPDSNANFAGEDPQWLYTVRFTARELWGRETRDSVTIDAFEPYLTGL